MRLSGKQIVDVSAEDARDLRAYAEGMVCGYMNHTRRSSELLTEWQAIHPHQSAMSSPVDFMSMVAVALADAPKDASQSNVEPFKGILANVANLPLPRSSADPIHPRYTFASGRDLWKRLAEAHEVNGNYYVRKQDFDSLQGACEHFWTLVHTRPNESHYLCECKTDGIVASHVNGRTKVIVVEDAVIPSEVCV